MVSQAITFPILPGKLEAWQQFCQELVGPRHEQHNKSRKQLGLKKEMAFHQATPMGDFAIVYMETEDPQKVMMGMATSQEPFDVWFRAKILELHGVDFSQPMAGPLPQLGFNWPAGGWVWG